MAPEARDSALDRWLSRIIQGVDLPPPAAAPRPPPGGLPLSEGADTARWLRARGGQRRRVWVVDDEPVVVFYLTELLRDKGCEVTGFSDSRQALGAFGADPQGVDVVVTDQRMPGLAGDALAMAMLRLRPRVCVVLCTGFSDQIDERRAKAIGIRHYLRKPFDAAALWRAVNGDDARDD
jgi:CheY-like chemotaxis protein